MPRKTKDQQEKEELKKEKPAAKKKASTKKTTTTAKKSTTTKKATTTAKKSTATKKAATTAKKSTATKKATTAKKSTATKKATTTAKKSTATKKATATAKKSTATKKATTTAKKSTATKKSVAKEQAVPLVEYYDLPYRYNKTVVKLLAQTPTTLFVYWDISDEDRENYKKSYGDNFFEETRPVLIVKNNTMNYSFEVEINDFANSWYLHVNDSKCDYSIELGRHPVSSDVKNILKTDYIYVTSSNEIESPNDKILFNIDEQKVQYKNIKNNITSMRAVSFINNLGRIFNIYELYDALYKDEKDNIHNLLTSSGALSSSQSSWFK